MRRMVESSIYIIFSHIQQFKIRKILNIIFGNVTSYFLKAVTAIQKDYNGKTTVLVEGTILAMNCSRYFFGTPKGV